MVTETSIFARRSTLTCATTAPFGSDVAARAPNMIQEEKVGIEVKLIWADQGNLCDTGGRVAKI